MPDTGRRNVAAEIAGVDGAGGVQANRGAVSTSVGVDIVAIAVSLLTWEWAPLEPIRLDLASGSSSPSTLIAP